MNMTDNVPTKTTYPSFSIHFSTTQYRIQHPVISFQIQDINVGTGGRAFYFILVVVTQRFISFTA